MPVLRSRHALLVALAWGCTPTTGTDTSSPTSVQATPSTVTVEQGKTANVAITFLNINNQSLNSATWLPLCTVQSNDQDVATVQRVGDHLVVTGQGVGTTTITVTSSAGVHTTITVTVTEPTPVITSVTPTPVIKGKSTTLTISGTGILPGAIVQIGGITFNNAVISAPGQLQLSLPRAVTNLLAAGTLPLVVYNPPNGALSTAVNLPVVFPAPVLESISPSSVAQGFNSDVELTVTLAGGADNHGFAETKVRWEGSNLVSIAPGTGNTILVTIPKINFVTAGTFNITVFNPAPGGGTSLPLPFTVVPAAGTAKFDFSNYEPQLAWAAQSQGNGPFVQVPIVNKQVEFPVSAATASLAFVSSTGTALRSLVTDPATAGIVSYQVTVISMTSTELLAGTIPMGTPFGTATLSGTASGVGAGQTAALLWGNGNAFVNNAQPTFAMTNASPGPHTLVGYRKGAGITAGDRVFVRAGQVAGSGIALDFNGAESGVAASATATLAGLVGGDNASGLMGYTTEATCEGIFLYQTPASSSFLITGIPGAMQGANDRHIFIFNIFNGNTTLQQTFYAKTLTGFAGTRPATIPAPVVTNASAVPYQIKQAVVDIGAYNAATLFYSNMSLTATKGFLGGSTGTLRAPDLSGVSGWNPAWAPAPTTSWVVVAQSNVNPLPGCAEGSTRTTVSITGTNP